MMIAAYIGMNQSAPWEVEFVPPFKRNPSAWSQRVPIAVLAGISFLICVYLSFYQWELIDTLWDPFFGNGSEKVLKSHASEKMWGWFGIPDAAMGALAYLGDAIYGMAGTTRRWQSRPWLVILFGIDVIPLGLVSSILVFLQGHSVGHYCSLCLLTAIVSIILIVYAYDEVWASLKWLAFVKKKTGSKASLWKSFWGRRFDSDQEVIKVYLKEAR